MHITIYGIEKRHRGMLTVYGTEGIREYHTSSTAKAVRNYTTECQVQSMQYHGAQVAKQILRRSGKMLPEKTYYVTFVTTDGATEEHEHTTLSDARYHYDMFGKSDADMYVSVSIWERDWKTKRESMLETKLL